MPSRATVATAIPYVNATPHIGNVLTTLAGDITARYFRMRGQNVLFTAGTDENALKNKDAAEKAGRPVGEFVKEVGDRFVSIFHELGLSYDEFIRTAEPRHRDTTQRLFQKLLEAGHIYQGPYEGWYDPVTETYFKESDLVEGKSPDGNEVRWVSETNYFFRLSAFEQPLLDAIESGRMRVLPESRKNEVVSFIKAGLRDACISRSSQGWGIPVPGDEGQTIYVWFDALINYITAVKWPEAGWQESWPSRVQWLGKDILVRFHATLWPAMLHGAGLPMPEAVVGHGWILNGDEKISKSKGNVILPLETAKALAAKSGCADEVAIDVLRYWMAATMPFDGDVSFTTEDFEKRYNGDLANDLGNALNRSLAMAHKFAGGVAPGVPAEAEALAACREAKQAYEAAFADYRIDRATGAALDLIRWLNKYIDRRAPWALAKAGDPSLPAVLRSMLLCLRTAEGLVRPVMPKVANAMAKQIGVAPVEKWDDLATEALLAAGTKLGEPAPIFPRIEAAKPEAAPKAPEPKASTAAPAKAATAAPAEISIEDFLKVQLKVGRVFDAEPLEGSDKLLKLQVVIGTEKRQIVAGIRANYSPEDLVGKQVIVVANLKPAKLRGVESQGMLLAAVAEDGGAILLEPDKEAPEGAQVR